MKSQSLCGEKSLVTEVPRGYLGQHRGVELQYRKAPTPQKTTHLCTRLGISRVGVHLGRPFSVDRPQHCAERISSKLTADLIVHILKVVHGRSDFEMHPFGPCGELCQVAALGGWRTMSSWCGQPTLALRRFVCLRRRRSCAFLCVGFLIYSAYRNVNKGYTQTSGLRGRRRVLFTRDSISMNAQSRPRRLAGCLLSTSTLLSGFAPKLKWIAP